MDQADPAAPDGVPADQAVPDGVPADQADRVVPDGVPADRADPVDRVVRDGGLAVPVVRDQACNDVRLAKTSCLTAPANAGFSG